ncbi:MAG: CaiB/BaiF CoA transferase family protein [Smithellaceae bacterium]
MLSGILILDLTDERGSFCSRLLADLGASVIKLERPGGDCSRNKGPFRKGTRDSLSFAYLNANKQGITLDIEQETGRELFFALVQKSDVLVETFVPGHLEKAGMGFSTLRQKNPRLIHLSLTGFGQTGPRRNYRSCDIVSSAFGGQMYVSGSPSGPPSKLYDDQAAYAASLSGAVTVLLAIRKRNITGAGTYIDLSFQEALVSTLDHVMVRYFHDRMISKRLGGHYWNNVFHIFPCKDGRIQLTLLYQWEILLEWMNSEGMAGDLTGEVWKEETYRIEHIDHIIMIIEQWTMSHQTHELFEKGQALQFPWAPVFSPEEVLASPQLEARQFFTPVAGTPGMPYRFSRLHQTAVKPAPLPGEHNREVYMKVLGLDENRLDALSREKVI